MRKHTSSQNRTHLTEFFKIQYFATWLDFHHIQVSFVKHNIEHVTVSSESVKWNKIAAIIFWEFWNCPLNHKDESAAMKRLLLEIRFMTYVGETLNRDAEM